MCETQQIEHFLGSRFFFIVLRHQSWGVPFGELAKLILFLQYKKTRHFGGPVFLLKRCSLGTSDIQGCYLPKGITDMIYTLIHERDPIPCRTTYIEYRSPVNIFINFLRITTQFHWFSLQNSFFLKVLRHQSWGVPFGEPGKLMFLIQYKKKLVISGDLFFLLKCSS